MLNAEARRAEKEQKEENLAREDSKLQIAGGAQNLQRTGSVMSEARRAEILVESTQAKISSEPRRGETFAEEGKLRREDSSLPAVCLPVRRGGRMAGA